MAREQLAVLDVVERDAAVRVPRRELLAVGAPGQAADGLLVHADHKEALPRHAMHQDLGVGRDERDQVHGGAPLHGENIAAAALGEALEDLEGRHAAASRHAGVEREVGVEPHGTVRANFPSLSIVGSHGPAQW